MRIYVCIFIVIAGFFLISANTNQNIFQVNGDYELIRNSDFRHNICDYYLLNKKTGDVYHYDNQCVANRGWHLIK